MKRFQFRLQKVLEYKEEIEKQRMHDLADAREELARQVERYERIQAVREENTVSLSRKASEKEIHPDEIQAHLRYQRKLEADLSEQNRRVAGAEAHTEKQRQILLEAAKERKTLETLKEQKLLTHRAESDRQERNFFDEVATMRHHRGRDNHD